MAGRTWQPGGPRPPAAAPPAGVKRPVAGTVGSVAKVMKTSPAPAGGLVVFSTADRDEIGIRTLVGNYAEQGTNHGRNVYKKSQPIRGHEDVEVFLYYWDDRDGDAFRGWWFGSQVGGAQVWSRSRANTMMPPKSGWTIPWDGEVNKELVVMSAAQRQLQAENEAKVKQVKRMQDEAAKANKAPVLDWETRVQNATQKVAEAEIDTEEAIEEAQTAASSGDPDAVAKASVDLNKQLAALAETQRSVASESIAAKAAPPQLKAEMIALPARVKQLLLAVREEMTKLKNSMVTQVPAPEEEEDDDAPVDERTAALEMQHSKQLEEMLPVAMEKVDLAEDEVEKAAIAAAPLRIDTADDLRSVMLGAIKETEQRYRAAQAAIGDARRFITSKISQASRFVKSAKKAALEEFSALQTRLNDAQEKLNPYKNVRQDYEQRAAAKKLHEELSGKLAGAEIEVEKAAMMTAPLSGDSSDAIKETEAALSSAQSALSQTNRLIEAKLRTADKSDGAGADTLEDIKALKERCRQSQEKLDEVRRTMKETQIRVAADSLLKDVSDKVGAAEDELQRMAEAELPFLTGGQKTEEMENLIQEADKVAAKVHTSISDAQTFVARKLVEVARFTEGPAKAVREEIDMMQKRLEDGRQRLQQFKIGTAARKREFLLQDVEAKVAAAEAEVTKMTEAAAAIGSLGAAGEALPDGLTEALEQANLCERAAQAGVVVARKHLIQRTAELKKLVVTGAGSGAELGKLQTRVNNMQHEISKLRAATKEAEERVRVKQMLSEVAVRLQAAEGEVDRVAAAAAPLAQAEPSPEQMERIEKASTSAQMKLSATAKLVDIKLKNATGFLKDELQGLRGRITQAEAKLQKVMLASKDHKERLEAFELNAQAAEKVAGADAAVHKTDEAALPFLKGLEVLAAKEAQVAIAECEKAATAAQKQISEARTYILEKLAASKQFSSTAMDSCSKDLMSQQKKLDACAARLAEMKKETSDRKRKLQLQASGEKVEKVEESMKALSAAMDKFSFTDSELTALPADEARTLCENIAAAEQSTQSALSEARKFLAARTQEAKTLPEAQRSAAQGELAKLQARVTHCQVELAKLSKQSTEREQRFVANKLLKEAEDDLRKLHSCTDVAAKAAQPLLAKDTAGLLSGLRVHSLVEALHAAARKPGATVDGLFSKLSGGKASATEATFTEFLSKLPELLGDDDVAFAESEAKDLFKTLALGKESLTKQLFDSLLRERRICVAATEASEDAKGTQETTVIEVGEGVEIIDVAAADAEGRIRARVFLARDGSTLWTTLEGPEGPNFEQSLVQTSRVDSIDACAAGLLERCSELGKHTDQKMVEVSSVKQGPLAEVKAKLAVVRTKVTTLQAKIDQLRKDVLAAKVALVEKRKEELQALHVSRFGKLAKSLVGEATIAVDAAEKTAAVVIETAKTEGADKPQAELGHAKLAELRAKADAALQQLADAKAAVVRAGERLDASKGASEAVLLEPKVQLTKLTSRVTTAERKCLAATESVRTAFEQAVKAATKKAREVLRVAARQSGKTCDQLFTQVAAGKDEMSAAQFKSFVEGLPDHGLSKEQIDLAYNEFGRHGLKRVGFAKVIQEFKTCTAATPITSDFEKSSKTVRRLEAGEVFEVLEGPRESADSSLSRVRGRALRDGAEGWVTVQESPGAPFLKHSEKPFLCSSSDAPLHAASSPTAAVVRKLQRDEVLELIEGPRQETPAPGLVMEGTASSDSASGWVTLRNAAGVVSASRNKDLFVCRSPIAMTDVFDIKACNVVRKVDRGEVLLVIGGREGKEDSDVEITRLHFRALRDDKEGWVTLKGNQGTLFVEESDRHYTLDSDAVLRSGRGESTAAVRTLKAGEAFEAKAAPLEEKSVSLLVVRARGVDDGKEGWIVFAKGSAAPVRPWRPRYVCRRSVDLTADSDAASKVSRPAQVGEVFEVVDVPVVDKSSGLRRVLLASSGVNAGWATIRGSDGVALMEVK
eukprot:TRINITY_DN71581_c0_g1_i1.p1 TRINITY_DN71581_c0_g1~~TRINITY_DN71581_c0_g1_i1.p1  ORF type:complete len:2009 (+),score=514.05 TRINITY_DN71581_c0_g1_i1:70-6027(+)